MPAFFKYTLGNTYMLYIFDMAIDQGHILEQAGSDIENSGADAGFRRGGFCTFRRGGFVQEFQDRIQIVAGPWANQQAKKNCRQP